MMCSTWLSRRLPARESRWRIWSPLEASIGAVPVQLAKCGLGGEPVDRPDVAQDPGRAGRADPEQSGQSAAGVGDRVGDAPPDGLELAVRCDEFAELLDSQRTAGAPDHVTGPHGGQQRSRLGRGEVPFRAAGNEFGQ